MIQRKLEIWSSMCLDNYEVVFLTDATHTRKFIGKADDYSDFQVTMNIMDIALYLPQLYNGIPSTMVFYCPRSSRQKCKISVTIYENFSTCSVMILLSFHP